MADTDDLARRHAHAFASTGRAWSATEFADLLQSPHVVLTDRPTGFALTRIVADEAEILTIATDPEHRRQGHARALLAALESQARTKGAATLFLEVSQANSAARALYSATGFTETARRKAYYQTPNGTRTDALILSKDL